MHFNLLTMLFIKLFWQKKKVARLVVYKIFIVNVVSPNGGKNPEVGGGGGSKV